MMSLNFTPDQHIINDSGIVSADSNQLIIQPSNKSGLYGLLLQRQNRHQVRYEPITCEAHHFMNFIIVAQGTISMMVYKRWNRVN